jgi:hypothetical protein
MILPGSWCSDRAREEQQRIEGHETDITSFAKGLCGGLGRPSQLEYSQDGSKIKQEERYGRSVWVCERGTALQIRVAKLSS